MFCVPTRLHRTESFRLTATVAAVIVGAMIILMAPVYYIMRDAFRTELLNSVDQDVSAIATGYRTDGLNEAKEVVAQLLSNDRSRGFYVLQKLPNTKLAGNLPAMAPNVGPLTVEIPPALLKRQHGQNDHHILGRGAMIAPGLYLYAGRDSYIAIEAQEDVLKTFGWVLACTLIVALIGGLLVSRSVLGRMDAITRTCRAIMVGNLSDRVPASGMRGEFDLLARTINDMLDRISALMENIQQISNDIAHDLRTPLSRLRNRLELALAEAETADDYRRVVAQTIGECEAILTTFSSLLRIGQIEAAAGKVTFAPVNLSTLLSELVEIYRPAAEDGGYILTGTVPSGLCVEGDQALLSQVFANLIENAMAHTARGTHIQVTLGQDHQIVIASVCDNGPGIPDGECERVLRRFYRCERSRSSPGSGLGLSLVAAIAKYHGAALSLTDNHPGLRVVLRFPISSNSVRSGPHSCSELLN